MRWTSIVAIFSLFWAMSFFFVLPFRLQRKGGSGDNFVAGQAPSAPPRFSFGRTCWWTTIVAIVMFALYYTNYVTQWLPVEALDWTRWGHTAPQ